LGDIVSPEMRDDLRRGLAERLSDRKLTAMELEQSFGAASDDAGRAALAHAMNTTGSRSSAPAPDSTPAPPPLRTAPRSAGAPPMRSKKATLLGTPRPKLGLDEPGAAIAAPVTPDPAQFAPGLNDLNLVGLDHTIALEGKVTVAESPASVPVPALDWGSDEPTAIQPRAALDAEVAVREADAGPFADEATQQSARDGAVPRGLDPDRPKTAHPASAAFVNAATGGDSSRRRSSSNGNAGPGSTLRSGEISSWPSM